MADRRGFSTVWQAFDPSEASQPDTQLLREEHTRLTVPQRLHTSVQSQQSSAQLSALLCSALSPCATSTCSARRHKHLTARSLGIAADVPVQNCDSVRNWPATLAAASLVLQARAGQKLGESACLIWQKIFICGTWPHDLVGEENIVLA